jgi:hypothetical protein
MGLWMNVWRNWGSNPNQWMTYTLVTTTCWG